MRPFAALLAAALATAPAASAAPTEPAGFWVTPAVPGYGRVHPLPQAAYRPDPSQTYRIVFAVTVPAKSPDQVDPSLDRVARTINLYISAGVPLDHLKFVAVVGGQATPVTLDDPHYRAAYGVANPNLPLVEELRRAGVDVAVCGQAVAEHGYQYGWIDRQVTVSLSQLTTVTTLEHQGYDLMPL